MTAFFRYDWMSAKVTVAEAACLVFQCPGLDRAINLAQVVDAGVFLRLRAGADEVGNGNRGQQANDGDDDHDFHQREPVF